MLLFPPPPPPPPAPPPGGPGVRTWVEPRLEPPPPPEPCSPGLGQPRLQLASDSDFVHKIEEKVESVGNINQRESEAEPMTRRACLDGSQLKGV